MLNAGYAGAVKLAAWKRRVKTGWPSVRVEHVESSTAAAPSATPCG
jgi:starch phosphorylase